MNYVEDCNFKLKVPCLWISCPHMISAPSRPESCLPDDPVTEGAIMDVEFGVLGCWPSSAQGCKEGLEGVVGRDN